MHHVYGAAGREGEWQKYTPETKETSTTMDGSRGVSFIQPIAEGYK